jgi:hypothetical protein
MIMMKRRRYIMNADFRLKAGSIVLEEGRG